MRDYGILSLQLVFFGARSALKYRSVCLSVEITVSVYCILSIGHLHALVLVCLSEPQGHLHLRVSQWQPRDVCFGQAPGAFICPQIVFCDFFTNINLYFVL